MGGGIGGKRGGGEREVVGLWVGRRGGGRQGTCETAESVGLYR